MLQMNCKNHGTTTVQRGSMAETWQYTKGLYKSDVQGCTDRISVVRGLGAYRRALFNTAEDTDTGLPTWQQHVWRHQQQLQQPAVLLIVQLCAGVVLVLAWLCAAGQYLGFLCIAAWSRPEVAEQWHRVWEV